MEAKLGYSSEWKIELRKMNRKHVLEKKAHMHSTYATWYVCFKRLVHEPDVNRISLLRESHRPHDIVQVSFAIALEPIIYLSDAHVWRSRQVHLGKCRWKWMRQIELHPGLQDLRRLWQNIWQLKPIAPAVILEPIIDLNQRHACLQGQFALGILAWERMQNMILCP